MKHPNSKIVILFLLLFSTSAISFAQLRFPKGTVLNLHTSINFLYYETEILFYTGQLSVDKYSWVKVSDSIDTRWLIGSCFNGDCWNGLPATGTFIKSFGINDSTGFIRFHIETHDLNGKSVIRYKVVNKSDSSEQAVLTFNVTFEKETGIESEQFGKLAISTFYNSVDNILRIQFNKNEQVLSGRIIDVQGKTAKTTGKSETAIVINDLADGIYIIELKTAVNTYYKKIIIN